MWQKNGWSPPYSVDGWRLDVAADLGHTAEYNHAFWKKFRKAVKEANPQALSLRALRRPVRLASGR